MQTLLVFLILFMTTVINLPHSYIARFGFEPDYLMVALATIVIALLIQHRNLLLVILVVFCSVCANMPDEIMEAWGWDKELFFGVLVALVVLPVGAKMSGRMR